MKLPQDVGIEAILKYLVEGEMVAVNLYREADTEEFERGWLAGHVDVLRKLQVDLLFRSENGRFPNVQDITDDILRYPKYLKHVDEGGGDLEEWHIEPGRYS